MKSNRLRGYLFVLLLMGCYTIIEAQTSTFQSVISGNEAYYYPRIVDDGNQGFYVLYRAQQESSGDYDVMLTRLDSLSQIIWTRRFGDANRNLNKEMYKTDYGLLLVLWRTREGLFDDWQLIKVDPEGNVLEEKFYGDERDEEIYFLTPLDNDRFAVASSIRESGTNANFSILNEDLTISNIKTYVLDNSVEAIRAGILTQNNNLLFCGGHQETDKQPMIMSTDQNGNLNFMQALDIDGDCDLNNLLPTSDNQYLAVGYTNGLGNGDYDILVVKFTENGNLTWAKTIGGEGDEKAFDIKPKNDGTFLITGGTSSESNNADLFLININEEGTLLSGHVYGGSGNEKYGFADITQDHHVVIAAQTNSFGSSSSDIFIVKADEDGGSCCGNTIQSFAVKTVHANITELNPLVIDDYLTEAQFSMNNTGPLPDISLICYNPLKISGRGDLCPNSKGIKYISIPDYVLGFFNWIVPDEASITNNQGDTAIYVDFGEQSGYIYLQSKYCINKKFDSLYVSIDGLDPHLGNDTTICSNQAIDLSPGTGYSSYLWQDGSTEYYYQTNKTGSYWVSVKDDTGCEGSDTINISVTDVPDINLGPDSMLIKSEYVDLDAGSGFDSYLWNDNSTKQIFRAYNSGKYWVMGIIEQCSTSDTIFLFRKSCQINVPNAFTPNGDNINDDFYVIPGEVTSQFSMMIFNRWGLIMIETDDVNYHWDGNYKGKKVPQGVYYWIIKYQCLGSAVIQNINGSVTVLY